MTLVKLFWWRRKQVWTNNKGQMCWEQAGSLYVQEGGSHNFNVKLEYYAERDYLWTLLDHRAIEQYISIHGRGLVVSLVRHSCTKCFHLKFGMLPYLEVYVLRHPESYVYDDAIYFGEPNNPENLVPALVIICTLQRVILMLISKFWWSSTNDICSSLKRISRKLGPMHSSLLS